MGKKTEHDDYIYWKGQTKRAHCEERRHTNETCWLFIVIFVWRWELLMLTHGFGLHVPGHTSLYNQGLPHNEIFMWSIATCISKSIQRQFFVFLSECPNYQNAQTIFRLYSFLFSFFLLLEPPVNFLLQHAFISASASWSHVLCIIFVSLLPP